METLCQCASPEPALVEHGMYSLCEKCGQYIGANPAPDRSQWANHPYLSKPIMEWLRERANGSLAGLKFQETIELIEGLRAACDEALECLEQWTQVEQPAGTLGTRMTINRIRRALGASNKPELSR